MKTIGRYLVFIIFLTGFKLSVEEYFSEMKKTRFLNSISEFHNRYREQHRVERLQRTPEMDLIAAQILDDTFKGQYNEIYNQYGINIFERKPIEHTRLDDDDVLYIFSKWSFKFKDYNFLLEPSNYESHKEYTQIVWQATKELGVALRCTDEKYVVLMLYYPRGNIIGQFKQNVLQYPTIANCMNGFPEMIRYEKDKRYLEDYIFDLHNEARIKHGVPELKHDLELDATAYKLLYSKSRHVAFIYEGEYGENYLEREYNNNTLLDEEEAEFTQIVWQGTKTMGIHIFREEGFYKVLAFYNPPGNIKRKFRSNVKEPRIMEQGESSSCIDIEYFKRLIL